MHRPMSTLFGQTSHPLTLEPTAGLDLTPLVIQPGKPVVLGRSSESDIPLGDETQTLSRRHAEVLSSANRWLVRDLGSRHGTSVNGVRLNADEPVDIQTGDLLRLGPWSFIVHIAAPRGNGGGATSIATNNDVALAVRVEQIPERELSIRAQAKLDLLLENAGAIASAPSEKLMAETALDVILRGTGFPRGAIVRPLEAAGEVQLIAARDPTGPTGTLGFALSRSLLKAASEGRVVRLDAGQQGSTPDYGQSIMSLGIHSALCAPIMFGGQLVALVYLDARGAERHVQPDAAAFCSAVAKLAGLSLSNLKRAELETRQKAVQLELHAAREAQRLILPPPERTFEANNGQHFRYAMHSRPGRFVSGDLFDVFPLEGGKLGVFLGDVAGKGAGAAVLMAAAQSHLHAVLKRTGDPKQAVELLNGYLDGRCPSGSFVTVFAAVIDPHDGNGTISFCDAGHGYWLTRQRNGSPVRHESGGGPPVGVMAGFEYLSESVAFAKESRLVLYSDGVHEQRLPDGEEFGLVRTVAALSRGIDPLSDVDSLLGALTRAAGPDHARPNTAGDIAFADDVTIASIELL